MIAGLAVKVSFSLTFYSHDKNSSDVYKYDTASDGETPILDLVNVEFPSDAISRRSTLIQSESTC